MPDPTASSGLLSELKRRRVFRVAAVYAVVAWLVIQVAVSTFPALQLPSWTVTFVVVLALLGLPISLVLAWAFELTPEGVRRAEPETNSRSGSVGRLNSRAAAWIGAGIVAGLVSFAAYGWFAASAPGAAERGGDRSIAVLPFENMSDVAENEYFSDGITEDILTQLAGVQDLAVVSRTSVMKYKDSRLSIPQIARELGVSYILEGSVRRAGDRVLVTAQLIDASRDQHIWADKYDRDLTDIFAVQGQVAAAIARELQASLTPGERERLEGRPTADIDAYDLVLRAREMIGESSAQNESAVELLRQAIRIDPTYADAYAALAGAYMQRVQVFGFPAQVADSGAALARRGIELDPNNARAYSSLGSNLVQLGRDTEARAAYMRALELNPSSGTVLNNLGILENRHARWDRAFELLIRARRLDPRSSYPPLNLATIYAAIGDTASAARELDQALALGHPASLVRAMYGLMELQHGDAEAAMRRLERLLAEYPDDFIATYGAAFGAGVTGRWDRMLELTGSLYTTAPDARAGENASVRYLHATALSQTGRSEEARPLAERIIDDAESVRSRGEGLPVIPYEAAGALALQGRAEEAMVWLERAYDSGFRSSKILAIDPSFDAVRGEPRYRQAMARMEAHARTMAERVTRVAAASPST